MAELLSCLAKDFVWDCWGDIQCLRYKGSKGLFIFPTEIHQGSPWSVLKQISLLLKHMDFKIYIPSWNPCYWCSSHQVIPNVHGPHWSHQSTYLQAFQLWWHEQWHDENIQTTQWILWATYISHTWEHGAHKKCLTSVVVGKLSYYKVICALEQVLHSALNCLPATPPSHHPLPQWLFQPLSTLRYLISSLTSSTLLTSQISTIGFLTLQIFHFQQQTHRTLFLMRLVTMTVCHSFYLLSLILLTLSSQSQYDKTTSSTVSQSFHRWAACIHSPHTTISSIQSSGNHWGHHSTISCTGSLHWLLSDWKKYW